MKLSDFLMLDEEEKKMAVLHHAILIDKRLENDCLVFLFQLDRLYIEAYGNKVDKSITSYSVSSNTRLLEPYLEAIPIHSLFR